jgi:DNA-binding CsgD family transcriptional regulator
MSPSRSSASSPLPLDPQRWAAVVSHLGLSPQQARIAELVIRGKKDKEIMAELGIAKGTLRTYLERVHYRAGSQDRVQLVVRLFSLALTINDGVERRPTG